MWKIWFLFICVVFIITGSVVAYAEDGNGTDDFSINTVSELHDALQECKTDRAAKKIVENSDPKLVAANLENEFEKAEEIVKDISELDLNEIDSYCSENDCIDDADYSIKNYDIDGYQETISIASEDGMKIEVVNTDEKEDIDSSSLMIGATYKLLNDRADYKNKKYGDRKFTSLNKISVPGYPKTAIKLMMRYKLYKDKNIAKRKPEEGASVKAYDESAGNWAASVDVTAQDEGWKKSKKNPDYVSTYGDYIVKFSIAGYHTSTWHVHAYSRVTPKTWRKSDVHLEQYCKLTYY